MTSAEKNKFPNVNLHLLPCAKMFEAQAPGRVPKLPRRLQEVHGRGVKPGHALIGGGVCRESPLNTLSCQLPAGLRAGGLFWGLFDGCVERIGQA